jgi:formamidopyrimidine-DNA glycosylase
MPELPEVETMARELRPLVLGRTIAVFWCARPSILGGLSDPAELSAAIEGSRVLAVRRRAKIILFDLDDGSLLTYAPRMTGQFRLVNVGTPIGRHDRAGLAFSDGTELRIVDIRTFGRLIWYKQGSLDPRTGLAVFADLGPEPLDPGTTDITMLRAAAPRYARRPIKSLLLDQHFIAGVGNIYADEALWRSRLHPARLAGSLSLLEMETLWAELTAVLSEAVSRRGSTIGNYRSLAGEGQMGPLLQAYGRAGRACLRCGATMERLVVGGRGTSVCPVCQPAPSKSAPAR